MVTIWLMACMHQLDNVHWDTCAIARAQLWHRARALQSAKILPATYLHEMLLHGSGSDTSSSTRAVFCGGRVYVKTAEHMQ